jgi:hypothetical protein
MRPIRRSDSATVALAAATLVALPCLTSCTGKDITNPGESLGTFAVDAHRLTATCGEAQTPPDPWRFDVKLSQEGRTLYWVQNRVPVSGTLDGANHAQMKTSDTRVLREPTKTQAECVVRRDDQLDAQLDAKSAVATKLDVKRFSGTLRYLFTPETGSDCLDQISAATFDTLPCEMSFQLDGVPKPR